MSDASDPVLPEPQAKTIIQAGRRNGWLAAQRDLLRHGRSWRPSEQARFQDILSICTWKH